MVSVWKVADSNSCSSEAFRGITQRCAPTCPLIPFVGLLPYYSDFYLPSDSGPHGGLFLEKTSESDMNLPRLAEEIC